MAFSNKSKELREEYNLTQAQLAKNIKISRSCISMIEIGKNEPTATTLTAYADYFNISIDELLEREQPNSSHTAPMGDELSSEERRLLAVYKSLSPEMRDTLWSLLSTWTPNDTIKPRKKSVT